MNLVFSSNAPNKSKEALAELLFLNPQQYRVREGIVKSLAKFGHPRIVETGTGLSVRVGVEEAQTIFAFDKSQHSKGPVGVVVFIRSSASDIVIVHIAVQPAYTLQGSSVRGGLGVTLIEKVKEIATRIVGVKRVLLFYTQELVIRVNSSRSVKATSKADHIMGRSGSAEALSPINSTPL